MSPQDLAKVKALLPVSKHVEALSMDGSHEVAVAPLVVPGKRLRQDSKPLLNKLEISCQDLLRALHPGVKIHAQAFRVLLANGLWFKVDFASLEIMTCWECKGKKAFRGGFENLKSAAHSYPEFTWFLVWRDDGQWKHQRVLP